MTSSGIFVQTMGSSSLLQAPGHLCDISKEKLLGDMCPFTTSCFLWRFYCCAEVLFGPLHVRVSSDGGTFMSRTTISPVGVVLTDLIRTVMMSSISSVCLS